MGGAPKKAGGGDDHPFSGYNKKDIHTALVGNWVEERALEADTGIFRYQGWVGEGPQTDTVYAEKVSKPEAVPTHNRVIVHSNRLESTEWKTATQTVFQKPADRQADLRQYSATNKVGVRTAAMLAALSAQAAVAPPGDTIAPTTESTARESFKAYDLTGMTIGARVMKSQDGVAIPAAECDFTFRAESGMSKKGNIDAIRVPTVDAMGRLEAAGGLYEDAPVTVYTEKVGTGQYPNESFFGTRAKGPNPFAKNSDYSKPITDYTKDPTYVE